MQASSLPSEIMGTHCSQFQTKKLIIAVALSTLVVEAFDRACDSLCKECRDPRHHQGECNSEEAS
jgi:hypothetical protein